MSRQVSQIPLPASLLRDPILSEVDFEIWERVHKLLFANPAISISDEILNFYCLGYYKSQVYNGGHSQLAANMDEGESRSSFLVGGFIAGVAMVGAPEFVSIAKDFNNWLQVNPVAAESQTGFRGGRAEFLDDLDEQFTELNTSMQSRLVGLMSSSEDNQESHYIQDCIDRKGSWSGDLDALEMVWLLRSDLILAVPDEAYEATWAEFFA